MTNITYGPACAPLEAREHVSDKVVRQTVRVALAGNPNTGKTTLFNLLTGARQHVGNYPGVTVEKFVGHCRCGQSELELTDLPGTYGLTAYSLEERVTRRELLANAFDVVVVVVDASNLQRNLYLAVQILELGLPVVVALNMADVARKRGMEFDLHELTKRLGAPVVPMVASKGEGKTQLLDQILRLAATVRPPARPFALDYGSLAEKEIAMTQEELDQKSVRYYKAPPRWIAIKLLESDHELCEELSGQPVLGVASQAALRLEAQLDDQPEAFFAERRYAWLGDLCRQCVLAPAQARHTFSEKLDRVLTHRLLGLPLFLMLMYLVFHLTFTLGEPPMGWIETAFGALGDWVSSFWAEGSQSLLKSLLVDGIIGGVGGVLVFLPNIVLLFLAIALLEDSGYMARAAFLMDRLMHKIGLHGKSFIPMLIGFGCSVPAIMATRTLENRRDRMITMLVAPLMSCGARLPIYALLIPAFFPERWHGLALWSIYLSGIALAVICAKLLSWTLFKGEAPPFVMELPPYRIPTLRSVGMHMVNRCGAYFKKAGTIILGISIVLWAMAQWPSLPDEQSEKFEAQRALIVYQDDLDEAGREASLAQLDHQEGEATLEASAVGRLGRLIEPLLRPCGFDWKISTAMIGAFAAKEVFVAQMGVVYALGDEETEDSQSLRERLQSNYTPLQAYCIMLFCLISAPCMATIAVTRRESNSWKWALFQLGGLTALAWVVTTLVFQLGRVLGLGI